MTSSPSHLQYIRDKYAPLLDCHTVVQHFWKEDIIGIPKSISEYLDVMLGADSDSQSHDRHQISLGGWV